MALTDERGDVNPIVAGILGLAIGFTVHRYKATTRPVITRSHRRSRQSVDQHDRGRGRSHRHHLRYLLSTGIARYPPTRRLWTVSGLRQDEKRFETFAPIDRRVILILCRSDSSYRLQSG